MIEKNANIQFSHEEFFKTLTFLSLKKLAFYFLKHGYYEALSPYDLTISSIFRTDPIMSFTPQLYCLLFFLYW